VPLLVSLWSSPEASGSWCGSCVGLGIKWRPSLSRPVPRSSPGAGHVSALRLALPPNTRRALPAVRDGGGPGNSVRGNGD
jgi:hypothetical protein